MSSEDEESDVVDSDQLESEAAPYREEQAESHSSESRRKLRDQMQAEIEAFLSAGGRIEKLEPNASAHGPSITAGVNDLSR